MVENANSNQDTAYTPTVNAVPIVNSLPCMTNAKNAIIETRIGEQNPSMKKNAVLIRATKGIFNVTDNSRLQNKKQKKTFYKPIHLDFPCIHSAIDPLTLPCEELDKLYLGHQGDVRE